MRTLTTVTPVLAAIGYASAISFSFPSFQNTLQIPSFAQLKSLLTASTIDTASSPLFQLHKSLIEIPSIPLHEQDVAAWLANYLLEQNLTVETQVVGEPSAHRTNILAYPGKTRQTRVLLTSHIDVVPPFIPYREAGGKIYGRGSADAKGSVAAQTIALLELWQKKEIAEGDASLLFVVGEETTADGMLTVNELGLEWEAVIFGEPTEGKLSKGHKGIILFHLEAHGKAAHSGYPELGKNANHMLIDAIHRLLDLELPQDEVLGNSSINVGRIDGGVAGNVIPEKASADVVVRVAGGDVDELWERIHDTLKGDVSEISVTRGTPFYGGQVLDVDVEGFDTIICSYGTDVPNLHGNHKRYLYGPGSILVAHGDNEFVLKTDLIDAVGGYKKLVKEVLNPSKRPPSLYRAPAAAASENTSSKVDL